MLTAKTEPGLDVPVRLIVEEASVARELFVKSNQDSDLPGVYEITAPGIQACDDILSAYTYEGPGTFETSEKHMRERHAVVVACLSMLSNYVEARDLRAKKRLH